jgi:hypothetical protein
VGSNGVTGSEALAAAEKHAALLTARAGARDPSAVPSICRISTALQYNFGMFSGTGIVMCFGSRMHISIFCHKPCQPIMHGSVIIDHWMP